MPVSSDMPFPEIHDFFQEKGRMSDLCDVIGPTKIIIFHAGACILSESDAQFGE